MFSLADYDTLVGQVTPAGVVCLVALYIEEPQPIDRLSSLCRVDERTLRRNVIAKTELHNYTATNGIGIYITTKARQIITALIQAVANLIGLQAPAHAADPANPISHQAPLPLAPAAHIARASDQIILSDQNDQDQKSDQFEESDQSGAAQRAELEELLDAYRVKDPARSKLLDDDWVTPDRFRRAIARAQANPNRRSPSPLGLALHELGKHIDDGDDSRPAAVPAADKRPQARDVAADWLRVINKR